MHGLALLVPLSAALLARSPATPDRPQIAPNDNRHAAGRLAGGVLTVSLEAREGDWRPDGTHRGPSIATAAFAEGSGPLQTPGPLLRVPVGTEIRATVRNRLAKAMWLYGMGERRGLADSVLIAPGAVREMRFRVTEPGASYYAGRTGEAPVGSRLDEDSQLGGVIMVDPPGTRPGSDRIFAITSWFTVDPRTVSGLGPNSAVVFNGRAWPDNERLTFTRGDTVRFRIVNLSTLDHPLHLHGFYFTVDSKGDSRRDTVYTADQRRMAVTEYVGPMQTMSMTWVPERSGNWIFHCHFASHMSPREAMESTREDMTPQVGHAAMHEHMSGLVIGMTVRPRGPEPRSVGPARAIRLVVRSRARVYGSRVGYAVVLGGSPQEADPGAMPVPGPVLELTRGEPVAVTIVNRSHDQAAIHWHGIELESLPDGVPGWSGAGRAVLPFIAPGDSLTVRFTPPRAGTFMYHSHSNEMQQIGSGLYGALVVSEPGVRRDPATDRLMILSDGGPVTSFFDPGTYPPPLLNGQARPAPIGLAAGVPVRLRLINIRTEFATHVELMDGAAPARWRVLAKDGMPTPPHQAGPRPAVMDFAPGEIYDVEVTPRAGRPMTLSYAMVGPPPGVVKPLTVAIDVH